MTDWIVRGQDNLLANSKAREITTAKREWRITYAYEDLGRSSGICELCEQRRIRHIFEIENIIVGSHLWIGSECIKKFVPVFQSGREVTDEAAKGKLVDSIVMNLKTEDRQKRAFTLLTRLAESDSRFNDSKWKADWKLGYSVKQLQLIAVEAKKKDLPFSARDFRINTRRGRVLEQLYGLQFWQYRQLRAALPLTRRKIADARFQDVDR